MQVRSMGALCTFVPFRFDALKTSHKRIFQFNIILLFLLSCYRYFMLVVKSFCAVVVVAVIFLFLYFRDYIHTMECLLSACAQVVFRFVSFYVLNIALISFRCGFSLFR